MLMVSVANCKHVCKCLNAVMGLLMWPCLSYHNVFNQLHRNINVVVSYFEQKFSIKRRQRSKGLLRCLSSIGCWLLCCFVCCSGS